MGKKLFKNHLILGQKYSEILAASDCGIQSTVSRSETLQMWLINTLGGALSKFLLSNRPLVLNPSVYYGEGTGSVQLSASDDL